MDKEKKRLSLIISTDSFLPRWDGISRFLKEIVPLLKKEFKITILAPDFRDEFKETSSIKDVRIVYFPLSKVQIAGFTFAKPDKKVIQKEVRNADVIFNQTLGPIGLYTLWIAMKLKKQRMTYAHSFDWELVSKSVKRGKYITRSLMRRIVKRYYNLCDVVIVGYDKMRTILKNKGIRSKIEIIPLGVNENYFSPVKNKALAKRKVGLPEDHLVIGYCGRISREKNLFKLYKAFLMLKVRFKKISLLMVGEGISENKFKHKDVIMTGFKKDVAPYYKAMDIYCITSLTETTSLTTIEAMSTGLPVVCSGVGAIPYYVDNRKNGFIIKKNKLTSLVMILNKLLSDEDLRREIGHAARETVKSRFSWKKTSRSLINLIYSQVESENRD